MVDGLVKAAEENSNGVDLDAFTRYFMQVLIVCILMRILPVFHFSCALFPFTYDCLRLLQPGSRLKESHLEKIFDT